jgi:hypothetical protein
VCRGWREVVTTNLGGCVHPAQHVACQPGGKPQSWALQINNSVAHIVQNGALLPLAWQHVRVGDIVKVPPQQCSSQ